MAVTALDLAESLGMLQDDDVRHLVAHLVDLPEDDIPVHICSDVRMILDPHGERTAPPELYWGEQPLPQPASERATFPSPTQERDYPPI